MDSLWDNLGPADLFATAAKPKGQSVDAPTQQPMRAGQKPATQKKPTTDQKKVRRQMGRQSSTNLVQILSRIDGVRISGDMVIADSQAAAAKAYQAAVDAGSKPQTSTNPLTFTITGLSSSSDSSSTTNSKESSIMTAQPTEADLIVALAAATTLAEQSEISARIEDLRTARRESMAVEGALDWDNLGSPTPTLYEQMATSDQHLSPATASMHHTSDATDWLMDVVPSSTEDHVLSAQMRASATRWYEDVFPPVKQDSREFSVQAANAAHRHGLAYGLQATAAASVFLDQVSHLASREGIVMEGERGPYGGGLGGSDDDTSGTKDNPTGGRGSGSSRDSSKCFSCGKPTTKEQQTKEGRWIAVCDEHADSGAVPFQKRAAWGTDPYDQAPGQTVDTYVSDGRSSTPVGTSPGDVKTFDEDTGDNGPDPKSTSNRGDAPSLSEGDAPEGDSSESVDNPNYGQSGQDKSQWQVGNTDDKMTTQGSAYDGITDVPGSTATCVNCGGGLTAASGSGRWLHDKTGGQTCPGKTAPSETDPNYMNFVAKPKPGSIHKADGKGGWSDDKKTSSSSRITDNYATCPNHPGQSYNKSTGDCSCGSNHHRWANSNNPGGQKSSAIRTEADLVDDVMRWENGEMDEDETVTFFQGLIDSGAVWHLQGMYGRMATNLINAGLCHAAPTATATLQTKGSIYDNVRDFFSRDGLTFETYAAKEHEEPLFNDQPVCSCGFTTADTRKWQEHIFAGPDTNRFRPGHERVAGRHLLADYATDGQGSTQTATEAPSLAEGDTPEGDHAESPVQEPGQGATDQSSPTDSDRPDGGVNWTASLSAEGQVFARTLSVMASLDDVVGGYNGHQVAQLLLAQPGLPEHVAETLRAGDNPFGSSRTAVDRTPVGQGWDALKPGDKIRVGYEEHAHDGTFVRTEKNSNPDFYGDAPVVVYHTGDGKEKRYLPTGHESPRKARGSVREGSPMFNTHYREQGQPAPHTDDQARPRRRRERSLEEREEMQARYDEENPDLETQVSRRRASTQTGAGLTLHGSDEWVPGDVSLLNTVVVFNSQAPTPLQGRKGMVEGFNIYEGDTIGYDISLIDGPDTGWPETVQGIVRQCFDATGQRYTDYMQREGIGMAPMTMSPMLHDVRAPEEGEGLGLYGGSELQEKVDNLRDRLHLRHRQSEGSLTAFASTVQANLDRIQPLAWGSDEIDPKHYQHEYESFKHAPDWELDQVHRALNKARFLNGPRDKARLKAIQDIKGERQKAASRTASPADRAAEDRLWNSWEPHSTSDPIHDVSDRPLPEWAKRHPLRDLIPDLRPTTTTSSLQTQAGNPYPVGTPNWFDWEAGGGDPASHGPQSSGAPGGGIPVRGPLTPEQEEWLHSRGSRTAADDHPWMNDQVGPAVQAAVDSLSASSTAADAVAAIGRAFSASGGYLDSFDREHAFEMAAAKTGVDYEDLYDAWLASGDPVWHGGSLQTTAVAWGRRHYEDLASVISELPDGERDKAAEHFGRALSGTNPNYRRQQFEDAAKTKGYRVRGGTGRAAYTRGHYQAVADAIKSYPGDRDALRQHMSEHFRSTNPQFKPGTFEKASS